MTESTNNRSFDKSLQESLSAVMDGEASELELRRVLTNIDREPELRASWSRYQTTSAMIRGEGVTASVDLSGSIADLIADEPAHKAKKKPLAGWWGQVGKVAVAASVAVTAVFIGTTLVEPGANESPSVLAGSAELGGQSQGASAIDLPMGYGVQGLTARTVGNEGLQSFGQGPVTSQPAQGSLLVANPVIEEYLRQLMAEHANAGASGEGNLPFERVPRIEPEANQQQ
jgi:sigma-E factor negative regulatory protein RseA